MAQEYTRIPNTSDYHKLDRYLSDQIRAHKKSDNMLYAKRAETMRRHLKKLYEQYKGGMVNTVINSWLFGRAHDKECMYSDIAQEYSELFSLSFREIYFARGTAVSMYVTEYKTIGGIYHNVVKVLVIHDGCICDVTDKAAFAIGAQMVNHRVGNGNFLITRYENDELLRRLSDALYCDYVSLKLY